MQAASSPTKLYSPAEFARECGIGLTKARELIASGRIESIKLGKLRRVPEASLVLFIESLRRESRHGD